MYCVVAFRCFLHSGDKYLSLFLKTLTSREKLPPYSRLATDGYSLTGYGIQRVNRAIIGVFEFLHNNKLSLSKNDSEQK